MFPRYNKNHVYYWSNLKHVANGLFFFSIYSIVGKNYIQSRYISYVHAIQHLSEF